MKKHTATFKMYTNYKPIRVYEIEIKSERALRQRISKVWSELKHILLMNLVLDMISNSEGLTVDLDNSMNP